MSPNPVVVTLDGSKSAENAFPLARILAWHFNAPLRIVRVVPPDQAARLGDAGKATQEFADYALGQAESFGIDRAQCSAHLFTGPPAATILDDAMEQNAQAIVMASHGRSGFRATLIGSVTDKVVRGATIPVLVVPGVGGPVRGVTNILVPLDGSPDSERVLPLPVRSRPRSMHV